MPDQDITPKTAAEVATAELQPAPRPREARRFVWLAIFSLLLTIAAWILGSISGSAAIITAAIAIVVGAFAIKSRRHPVRNTAITSIIASAVLLVVIAAFMIVIYIGMQAL